LQDGQSATIYSLYAKSWTLFFWLFSAVIFQRLAEWKTMGKQDMPTPLKSVVKWCNRLPGFLGKQNLIECNCTCRRVQVKSHSYRLLWLMELFFHLSRGPRPHITPPPSALFSIGKCTIWPAKCIFVASICMALLVRSPNRKIIKYAFLFLWLPHYRSPSNERGPELPTWPYSLLITRIFSRVATYSFIFISVLRRLNVIHKMSYF